ncbi:DUF1534 domain-containing protein [Pseudomonas syringae]|nr:DUF1534 domain-containing protein [Pseudomonas syringae]MCF5473294.1 DUF1534 domain-containing protein [Pseudomonas syringae]MCF5483309.1 DUF1534 domain-containing protein [Pseudomonas syringae]MCF5487261.1 DUF1534 domain-containing protein [Pseudomonas syringae]MCF5494616.1 DUF1534 domain-containing protein [Pseudomonas syringae]
MRLGNKRTPQALSFAAFLFAGHLSFLTFQRGNAFHDALRHNSAPRR